LQYYIYDKFNLTNIRRDDTLSYADENENQKKEIIKNKYNEMH